ncbi:MAG: PPOX class F420-dependent oxidoreductase [Sporichthyaceae bacterium]
MGYTAAPDGWWQEFVSADPPRTAKIGIVRKDGSPAVAPIWVALDGEDVVFTTGLDTLKGKALQRDDRVCLCWDDDRPPFAFVTLYGRATLVEDLDQVYEWAGRLGARYMGADRFDECSLRSTGSITSGEPNRSFLAGSLPARFNRLYAKRNGVPGEVLVRVRPERVVAMVDLAE